MKLYLIYNPVGGYKKGTRLLRRVKPVFDSANIDLMIIETKNSGHAKELANQLDYSGYDGMCVIGGDGTMHEIVNGMLTRHDKQQLPIGLIAGGTGNSFMMDRKLLNPIDAANMIVDGNLRAIDVAEVKINFIVKYAFNIIGWGLVTDIGRSAEKHRWLGESRYTILSALEIMRYKPRPALIKFGDQVINDDFIFAIACNTMHTGKGMKMAPKAKLNDGLFDLIVVRHAKRIEIMKMLPKVFDGSHINHPVVEYYQTDKFSIIPRNDEILNIDGEILGSTPLGVKVLHSAIEVFG